MPKTFSKTTLQKFENACAGIPLRQLTRVFDGADIRMGDDPGEGGGNRRTHFRRYVASVDQADRRQLEQLGVALGAMIAEVADSKMEFLIGAAQSDGFVLADGVFRPAVNAGGSFALSSPEELASIDERGTRLTVLAGDRPREAVDGAREVVVSVCRVVVRLLDAPLPEKTAGFARIATSTLDALGKEAAGGAALVTYLDERYAVYEAPRGRGKKSALSASNARLTVGVSVAFARFVADAYAERAGAKA